MLILGHFPCFTCMTLVRRGRGSWWHLGQSRSVSDNLGDNTETQPNRTGFPVAASPVKLCVSLAAAPRCGVVAGGHRHRGRRGLRQAGPLPMWGGLGLLTRRVKKQDLGTLACLPRRLPRLLPEWGVCGPVRHVTSLLPRPRPRDAVRCFVRAVRVAGAGAETQARIPESSRGTRSTGAVSRRRGCQTTALHFFFWREGERWGWGAESWVAAAQLRKVHSPHMNIVSPVPACNPGPQPAPPARSQQALCCSLLCSPSPLLHPPPPPPPARWIWRGGHFSSMYDFLFVEVKFT